MNKSLRILLLSSKSPYHSANLGFDVINALQKAGHSVDFLTKMEFRGMAENTHYDAIFKESDKGKIEILKDKVRAVKPLYCLLSKLRRFCYSRIKSTPGDIVITNMREDHPPVSSVLLLEKINKKYDLVITLFWEDMMTAQSLLMIYNRLKCPIFIYSVDMFPMTGGCYYFEYCRRFRDSCGKCPALKSSDKNDQTYLNFQLKKSIYDSIKCAFLGNTWMNNFAKQSSLFNKSFIYTAYTIINESLFVEYNRNEARKSFGICENKKYIFFAGSAAITQKRKGFDYLVKAIKLFLERIPVEDHKEVLLLFAGKNEQRVDIQSFFDIDIQELGFLDMKGLIKAYSLSTIFLSTSISDAGPSMVNQSLMCGTPVVAFSVGVAIDLITNGGTGYLAVYKDSEDFASGIHSIYNLSSKDYRVLRDNCRNVALEYSSYDAFSKNIEYIYSMFG